MPCHAALSNTLVMIQPEQTVDEALAVMSERGVEYAAVVDQGKVLQGCFSLRILLKNLLPVSVAMQDGSRMDIHVGAAPGIAKRLAKVGEHPVEKFMQRRVNIVYPGTPLWEGIHMLVDHGTPLFVVEEGAGILVGVMTGESAFGELQRLRESV